MKAQEYFDKYFADLKYADVKFIDNANAMLQEMASEYSAIRLQRNVKTLNGAVGIVRELNEKWNSVEAKIEKKFGKRLLKRNVIWNKFLAEEWGHLYPRKPD